MIKLDSKQQAKQQAKEPLKTLISYCVENNPAQTKDFLRQANIKVQSSEQAKQKIMLYVGEQTKNGKGKNVLQKLFDIHPDKDLILEFFGKKPQEDNFSGNNAGSFELDGAAKSETPLLQSPTAKIAIVIAVIIALIAIIYQFD